MKIRLMGALAAVSALLATSANAVPITYDLTAAGGSWVETGFQPFGIGGQPTYTGSVTVDNALTGLAAFQSFSFTTGTHTWTLAEFIGPTASVSFDGDGNLIQFSLDKFYSGGVKMYFYSNNTVNIFGEGGSFYCNGCISIKAAGGATNVPEPASLAILGLGILGAGYFRRRRTI